jgi:hypothetical protein
VTIRSCFVKPLIFRGSTPEVRYLAIPSLHEALVVQDNTQQGIVDANFAVVFDET